MSVACPRRVSPMHHHAVVTLTFAEVGTCMDRSASVGCIRITNPDHRITPNHGSTPDLTQDHVRITPEHARITHHIGPDHTGSRPEHTGSRPDHTCRNTHGSRITPDRITPDHVHRTHRITSGSRAGTRTDHASHRTGSHRITSTEHTGSRAGTRTDHVSNRRTGSTPEHVRRSRRTTHVRRSRRNTPDHVRETWSHSGSSHPLSELFELFPPRDQLAMELIARRPADGA